MVPRVEHQVIDGVESKRCGICRNWKALDEFRSDVSRWDGLSNKCKLCHETMHKKSHEANPGSRREYHRQYAIENRERKTRTRTEWRARNRDRDEATRRRYTERNREKIQVADRARRPQERDRRIIQNQQWYAENKDHAVEQVRLWRINNPGAAARNAVIQRARRRARLRGLPDEPWTEEQLIARDGLACWINGCQVGLTTSGRRDWAIDHLVPIGVEYPDHPGNNFDNVAIACHPCNTWKAARLLPAAVVRYEANRRRVLVPTPGPI